MSVVPFMSLITFLGTIGCATTKVFRGTLTKGRIAVQRKALEFKSKKSKTVIVKTPELEYPILVVQSGAENYHALSVRCTHQGCHVRPTGNTLTCPCHGSTYDLEGRVIRGPAKAPLQRFDVEITTSGIDIIVARIGK